MAEDMQQSFVLRVGNNQLPFSGILADVLSAADQALDAHLPQPLNRSDAIPPEIHRTRFSVALHGRMGLAHEVLGLGSEAEIREIRDKANYYVDKTPERRTAMHNMVSTFMTSMGITPPVDRRMTFSATRRRLPGPSHHPIDVIGRHGRLINSIVEPRINNGNARSELDRLEAVVRAVARRGIAAPEKEAAMIAKLLSA